MLVKTGRSLMGTIITKESHPLIKKICSRVTIRSISFQIMNKNLQSFMLPAKRDKTKFPNISFLYNKVL